MAFVNSNLKYTYIFYQIQRSETAPKANIKFLIKKFLSNSNQRIKGSQILKYQAAIDLTYVQFLKNLLLFSYTYPPIFEGQ